MKSIPVVAAMVAVMTVASGCATKKFVHNQTTPIQAKVDQVSEQTNRQAVALEDTKKEVKAVDEKAAAGISAAKERAMTAENRANDAMSKANEANAGVAETKTLIARSSQELASLRNVVANIDDYRVKSEATVNFAFDKWLLSKEATDQLDKMVAEKGTPKRYVVSVAGYTDKIGSAEYNQALSKKRAESVVNYLVTKHSIPVFRIYTIGLGKEQPVDEGKTREARMKNRRVEVKVFTADADTPMQAANSAN